MKFYLGTHMVSRDWWDAAVPLFVSRRRLENRKSLPRAKAAWALDSGGFTELSQYGRWMTTENAYVAQVERYRAEVGLLEWVAPQDWMCEPGIIHGDPARGWPGTRLSIGEHQQRTIANFLRLRDRLGVLVIPVLQGWELNDYLRCIELYDAAGVALEDEPIVGLGSVCRRQDMVVAGRIVRRLADEGIALHGFGIKTTGVGWYGEDLASADSLSWSYRGRRIKPCPMHGLTSCANCLHHALTWRERLLVSLDEGLPNPNQLTLEAIA